MNALAQKAAEFQRFRQEQKRIADEAEDKARNDRIARLQAQITAESAATNERRRKRDEERQRELLQERIAAFRGLCPVAYAETDLGLLPRPNQSARAMAWRPTPQQPGLLLYGPSGTGKTRSAWTLLRDIVTEQSVTVWGGSATDWANECIEQARRGESGFIDSLCWNYRIVFLDDLDKVKFTERVEADFFQLVETRFANCRPLVITLNSPGREFEALLSRNRGPAIIRRVREFCHTINFEPEI